MLVLVLVLLLLLPLMCCLQVSPAAPATAAAAGPPAAGPPPLQAHQAAAALGMTHTASNCLNPSLFLPLLLPLTEHRQCQCRCCCQCAPLEEHQQQQSNQAQEQQQQPCQSCCLKLPSRVTHAFHSMFRRPVEGHHPPTGPVGECTWPPWTGHRARTGRSLAGADSAGVSSLRVGLSGGCPHTGDFHPGGLVLGQ